MLAICASSWVYVCVKERLTHEWRKLAEQYAQE